MKTRGNLHLIAATILGIVLGIPPAPPLLGYIAAVILALTLYKYGLIRQTKDALEYIGLLILSWTLSTSLLHP
ncbi:MAG: hypothetical protein NZ954_03730 [Thermofilaceae archaeon]|nr:hypothetical protein [Thermofilaceae archaeon]MCX8181318.1 hypothetical protein [Thermofilaceae archaeon]MDW8004661.1 hypothetical protein [Thermofilaceae archaeon]